MKATEIFEAYAADFEQTMIDNNWTRLEPYFAVDSEYVPGDGRHGVGPEGIVATLQEGVNALDRRFAERELVELDVSDSAGAVIVSFRVVYRAAGLPDLELWGEEHARIRGKKIVKMEDHIAPEALAAMENWFDKHGEQLSAARLKKVIVFGATGSLGEKITEQALKAGYEVTAFARRAERLEMAHERLIKVSGDVTDSVAVGAALENQDAVIFAVGAGLKGTVRAAGTSVVIDAMQVHGVKRLIALSTLGTGETWKYLNFVWKYLMFGLLLRQAFLDHEAQEAIIRDSGLEWTIIRPSSFTDTPTHREVHYGSLENAGNLQLKVPRRVLADFFVDQVADTSYLLATPACSC